MSLSVFLVQFLPPTLLGVPWRGDCPLPGGGYLPHSALQGFSNGQGPLFHKGAKNKWRPQLRLWTITTYLGWTSNLYWVTGGDKDAFHSSSPSHICLEGFRTQIGACVTHLCSPSTSALAMAKTSLGRGSLWPKAGVFRVHVLAFNALELLILL